MRFHVMARRNWTKLAVNKDIVRFMSKIKPANEKTLRDRLSVGMGR